MKEIGIGLLGFGTVGAGVVEGLQKNGEILAQRLGVRPVLRKIADVDLETDRGVSVDSGVLTSDAESVINDPDIDVVVELIGGTGVARKFVLQALEQGKPVVTANKKLLAEYGAEIFGLAQEKGVGLYFGASVGGGIPIIRGVRNAMVGNSIESIHGILNGTCNYILTRMETEHLDFDVVLKAAQEAGYAEADPSLDIDGHDTAHKATILASLACGSVVPLSEVHVEGIRDLSSEDIQNALDMGYRIKMLAVIRRTDGGMEVRVHPTLVPLDHLLASVSGVFNAVEVHSDMAGDTLYYGRGAGREPTASTVIADIADAAKDLMSGDRGPAAPILDVGSSPAIRDMRDIEERYYLRLSLLDEPGFLARVASTLGDHGISIASVMQKESAVGTYVSVMIVTHDAKGAAMDSALEKIDAMDAVDSKTIRLRIAD